MLAQSVWWFPPYVELQLCHCLIMSVVMMSLCEQIGIKLVSLQKTVMIFYRVVYSPSSPSVFFCMLMADSTGRLGFVQHYVRTQVAEMKMLKGSKVGIIR